MEPSTRRRIVALALAGAGLVLLALVVREAGAAAIAERVAALGWAAPLVLAPYALSSLVDAAGLGLALPASAAPTRPGLVRLALLRLAGESVNYLTPTGYLGGEPIKALLLARAGVPATDAVAAVVVAKTALIASQIAFVVTGLVLLVARRSGAAGAALAALTLALAGAGVVAALVAAQRRGLVARGARLGVRLFPRSRTAARLAERAPAIDAQLAVLYGPERRVFLRSTAVHLAGWLVGVGEALLMLALVGAPVSVADAFAIESLAGTLRALSIVVPATIGVQEAGGALVCQLVGVAPAAAVALMLLKRAREVVFTAVGLAVLGRGRPRLESSG